MRSPCVGGLDGAVAARAWVRLRVLLGRGAAVWVAGWVAFRVSARVAVRLGAGSLVLALAVGDAAAVRSGPLRGEPVELVVLHSTGGPTCDARTGQPVWVGAGTMEENLRLIEAHPRLGIHYMVDRDGTWRASVPEGRVAHHVFRHSVRSIAVELINDGDGRDPYPEPQLDALVALLKDIAVRHGLRAEQVRRHSDLDFGHLPCAPAQRRKVDPGEAFPHQQVLERVFGAGR